MRHVFKISFYLKSLVLCYLLSMRVGASGVYNRFTTPGLTSINGRVLRRNPETTISRVLPSTKYPLDYYRAEIPKKHLSIFIAASVERMDYILGKLIPALAAPPSDVNITLVSSKPEACFLAARKAVACSLAPTHVAKGRPPFVEDTMERYSWYSQVTSDLAFTLAQGESDTIVLFLEDDVIPTTDWYLKLMALINSVPDTWAMFDLYTPDLPPLANGDVYGFYCCTQALVFNKGATRPLVQYLNKHIGEEPPDWLLRDYQKEMQGKFEVRLAMPSLFQHMNLGSTLDEKRMKKAMHKSRSFIA